MCVPGKSGWCEKTVNGGDAPSFLCGCFLDPRSYLILAVMCVCAAVAYPSCGILLMMSHSCRLRLQGEHHTHLCTSHASPTGNVCFLLRFSPLFPIRGTKENVIHSGEVRLKCSPPPSQWISLWFRKEGGVVSDRIYQTFLTFEYSFCHTLKMKTVAKEI